MAIATLTGTTSLLHNNLASSSGGWTAIVHNSVNPGAGRLLLSKMGGASKDGPDVSQATSVSYVELSHGPVLVVSSTNGTQIYNEDGTAMVFYMPINDSTAAPLKYHQGACLEPALQHIVIGTSKGSLMAVQALTADQYVALVESQPAGAASGVVDLCFNAISNTIVSAHHDGEMRIWTINAAGAYENPTVLPAMGEAPVRVVPLGVRLLVAYGPGTLCIFDAITHELQAEITAHARWITALAVREDLGFVATVGEDTMLNVWQVDANTGQVGLQHSSSVADKLLTGVAFSSTGMLVSAYDTSDLYHVNM